VQCLVGNRADASSARQCALKRSEQGRLIISVSSVEKLDCELQRSSSVSEPEPTDSEEGRLKRVSKACSKLWPAPRRFRSAAIRLTSAALSHYSIQTEHVPHSCLQDPSKFTHVLRRRQIAEWLPSTAVLGRRGKAGHLLEGSTFGTLLRRFAAFGAFLSSFLSTAPMRRRWMNELKAAAAHSGLPANGARRCLRRTRSLSHHDVVHEAAVNLVQRLCLTRADYDSRGTATSAIPCSPDFRARTALFPLFARPLVLPLCSLSRSTPPVSR
jgi:hypothetical protein